MRVVASLSTNAIIQVEKSPEVGESRVINGKYVVAIPESVGLEVGSTSYLTPVDGNDVSSLAMAQLLVQYPMYSHVLFNPLLEAADINDLDLTASYGAEPSRAQVGRGTGPLATGIAPCSVAVLPENTAVSPVHPGILITDTIDISALTGGLGADEFMAWWQIYEVTTSADVTSAFGATVGLNDPALRSLVEIDQEPSDFEVYVSNDDGVTYTQVARVTPADLTVFGTDVRICFRNRSTTAKRYVASYAILF